MDTGLSYPEIIKRILEDYAKTRTALSDRYISEVLFDEVHGQYLLLERGWQQDSYLHATPIHLSLIEGKIWIQWDDTEEGVATDLLEAGVSKEDIVLGFRHPKLRQYTGFAVA